MPASHLLGDPGDGFKIAMSNLDIFRTTVGGAALGQWNGTSQRSVEFRCAKRCVA